MLAGDFRREKHAVARRSNGLADDVFTAVVLGGIDKSGAELNTSLQRGDPSVIAPGAETHLRDHHAGLAQLSLLHGWVPRSVLRVSAWVAAAKLLCSVDEAEQQPSWEEPSA